MKLSGPKLWRALVVLACWTWLAPSALGADKMERARTLYERGLQLFEEGYYEQAIDAWEESFSLSERPELQFNLAGAYERLGQREEALVALELYRDAARDEDLPTVDLRIKNLKRRIAEAAPEEVVTSETSRRWVRPVVASGLGVIAAGAAATGLVAGLGANTAGDDATAGCADTREGPLCTDAAAPFVVQQRRRALTADLAWAVAGTAAAGTVLVAVIPMKGSQLSVSPRQVQWRTRW